MNNSMHNQTFSRILNVYDYAIPLVGIIAIVTNLAVVISSGLILKKGQMPKTTYILLGNVAMADLLTAASTVFGQLFPKSYRDHYVCSAQIGMIVSSTLVSVYSLGLIAIDRFLYIRHGIKYQKWIYPGRVRIAMVFSWIIGTLIGFLPLLGWHGDTRNGQQCWFILLAPKQLILLTVIVGAIPLALVIALYSIILYTALANINRIRSASKPRDSDKAAIRMFIGNSQPKPPTTNKWRAVKVVLFTSGAFLCTWGPYFLACTIYTLTRNDQLTKKLSHLIASPFAILGFCNALINPLIYAWWHKGFRSFICKQFRRDDVQTTSSSTSMMTS